jgi:hypothetical protein
MPSDNKTRSFTNLIPRSLRNILTYQDPTVDRMASASPFSVYTIRTNDIYDPDPALGSAGISGFTEFATFYDKWRVHKVVMEWQVLNKTSNPVTVFTHLSQTGNVPSTYALAVDYAELPFSSKPRLLGPVTSSTSKAVIRLSFNNSSIVGNSKEFMANELFQGTGGTSPGSPANKLFVIFVAYSDANLTAGLYCNLRIHYHVTWFDRREVIG